MNISIILTITGALLTITGIYDGYKYHWIAAAIRKAGTAKGQSRKFINAAIINDIIRIIHCFIILDWWLIASSVFALIFMIEHWITIYYYYPYRNRSRFGFKKPNIFLYLINSLLPNKIRKKL